MTDDELKALEKRAKLALKRSKGARMTLPAKTVRDLAAEVLRLTFELQYQLGEMEERKG